MPEHDVPNDFATTVRELEEFGWVVRRGGLHGGFVADLDGRRLFASTAEELLALARSQAANIDRKARHE